MLWTRASTREGPGLLDGGEHTEQLSLYQLVLRDQAAALGTDLGVGESLFQRRARQAGEDGPHPGIGEGEDRGQRQRVQVRPDEQIVGRNAGPIEPDAALVEVTLPQLVERRATLYPGTAERDHGHTASRRTRRGCHRAEQQGVGGDGAVRHPGRLLPGDDPFVAVRHGPARSRGPSLTKGIHVNLECVGTVGGLRDGPTPDVTCLTVGHEGADHLVEHPAVPGHLSQCGRELKGQGGHTEAGGETGTSPAELLEHEVAGEAVDSGSAVGRGDAGGVVPELVPSMKDIPERRPLCCHLLRRHPVQAGRRRTEHPGGKAMGGVSDLPLLGGEVRIQFEIHDPPSLLPLVRVMSGTKVPNDPPGSAPAEVGPLASVGRRGDHGTLDHGFRNAG